MTFQTDFGKIDFVKGQQKSATLSVDVIERGLRAKVNAWNLAIQNTGAIRDSAAYKAQFPGWL